MAGAGNMGGPAERAHSALNAGCDMVLACNDPAGAYNIVSSLVHRPDVNHSLSTQRLLNLASTRVYNYSDLQKTDEWQQVVKLLSTLN